MGMKASSGMFHGTKGELRYKLDIQYFASGKMPLEGRILLKISSNQTIKNVRKDP